ncbi:MAG: AMP-dependent synthetase/ligase [Actinomycetota bacterium]
MSTTLIRQYTTPGGVEPGPSENLTTSLWRHEEERGDDPILLYREGDSFRSITYAEMAERVRRLAGGLIGMGLEPGTRVCIFSPTRYEFTLLDYAIWAAGCATVTIYETSSPEQVQWIISDSESEVVVCANDDLRKVVDDALAGEDARPTVLTIDAGGLDELIARGESVSDEQVLERARSVTQDDLATLVYTSGTTGMPKGCELTVRNFVWTVTQAEAVLSEVLHRGAVTLMFLPLAHSFARIVQVGSVSTQAQIAYSTGANALMEELAMVRPTWLFAVPRVFEKVYNGASQKAHDEGKGRIFDLAAKVAAEYSRRREAGRVGWGMRLLHGLFDRLVYSRLRDALGGRVQHAVSGGAGLGERLGHFFNGIGLVVLEGYGLTETSAASCVNPPGATKIGTVGQPVPGASGAIADDGEILLKGDMVFRGYWKNPRATAEVMTDDGWFQTGDVGSMDEDGYIRITGRKKEIIVTAGGKNVAPAVLEDRLRAHPLISQAMVVGDRRPFIGALITIDAEEYPRWAARHELDVPLEEAAEHPDLLAEVEEAVESANRAVSQAESIRRFRILPGDFSIQGNELTPTLKLRRNIISERYATEIESLYIS